MSVNFILPSLIAHFKGSEKSIAQMVFVALGNKTYFGALKFTNILKLPKDCSFIQVSYVVPSCLFIGVLVVDVRSREFRSVFVKNLQESSLKWLSRFYS